MPPPLDGGQELMDSGDRVDVSFAKALTTKVDRPTQRFHQSTLIRFGDEERHNAGSIAVVSATAKVPPVVGAPALSESAPLALCYRPPGIRASDQISQLSTLNSHLSCEPFILPDGC
jgi:hypothetical protein